MKKLIVILFAIWLGTISYTQHNITVTLQRHSQVLAGHEADLTNLQMGKKVQPQTHVDASTPRPTVPVPASSPKVFDNPCGLHVDTIVTPCDPREF